MNAINEDDMSGTPKVVVNIRVRPHIKEALKVLSDANGITVSEQGSEIFEMFFDGPKSEEPPKDEANDKPAIPAAESDNARNNDESGSHKPVNEEKKEEEDDDDDFFDWL